MKRLLLYGMLGLAAYGIFMVARLPATTAIELVANHIPRLSAQGAEGTVFYGHARALTWRNSQVQSLAWGWNPLGLLGGRVAYDLHADGPELALQGSVGVNLGRQLQIADLQGQVTLSWLLTLLDQGPLFIDGTLDMAWDEIEVAATGLPASAYGTVKLLDTHTSIGRTFQLGDFEAVFDDDNGIIRGDVRDLGGPIKLTGILTLTADGRYRFVGQLGVRGDNRDLRQILGILGRPDATGNWQLNFSGSLGV